MTIAWTADLNTGHRSIDMQHQDLVEMIGELETSVASGAGVADLTRLMQGLQQYVLFHFSHEESMMQRSRIDAAHAEIHLAEHAEFAARVQHWMDRLADPETAPALTSDVFDYLLTWLVAHIQGTDMELTRQLASLSLRLR